MKHLQTGHQQRKDIMPKEIPLINIHAWQLFKAQLVFNTQFNEKAPRLVATVSSLVASKNKKSLPSIMPRM